MRGSHPYARWQLSAVRVTGKTLFERLYLVLGLRKIAPWVNCPYAPTSPTIHCTNISRFLCNFFQNGPSIFGSTIHQVICQSPGTLFRGRARWTCEWTSSWRWKLLLCLWIGIENMISNRANVNTAQVNKTKQHTHRPWGDRWLDNLTSHNLSVILEGSCESDKSTGEDLTSWVCPVKLVTTNWRRQKKIWELLAGRRRCLRFCGNFFGCSSLSKITEEFWRRSQGNWRPRF